MMKQRESFEQRMKEMEEEMTKASLGRYKAELESKQQQLKITKKYENQQRELRHCLSYLLGRVGVINMPDFLKEDLACSISEVQVESKELLKVLEEFD